MKKLLFLCCTVSLIVLTGCKKDDGGDPSDEYQTIELNSTPTQSRLTEQMLGTAPRIRIKGTINQEDFKVLHQSTTLQDLDLSDVSVVGDIILGYDLENAPYIQHENAIPYGAFGQYAIEDTETGKTTTIPANETLQSILLPTSITTIGRNAFYACTSLSKANLPAKLESIMNSAFGLCRKLSGELSFPEGVKILGEGAFSQCALLTGTLTIPKQITHVAPLAFVGCTGFTKLSLHDDIALIDMSTFAGMTGLTELTLPENLDGIGLYAFRECTGLRGSLVLPDYVNTVLDQAFSHCGFDGTLTLPRELRKIEPYAFYIPNLKTIVANWETTEEIATRWEPDFHWFPENFEASKNKPEYVIYIPAGTTDIYTAAFSDEEGKCFYNIKEGRP